MSVIFLYPGQGSQIVGMGKDLVSEFPAARRRYAEASEILGFDLAAVSFEGPESELRQTLATQPALYVHSCILTDLLADRGLRPQAAAGHSLGEYSALYAAQAFTFADGLRLVKVRADAMQAAGVANPGTMAAVVGLDDDAVKELCRKQSTDGVVVPANYNSPGQLVISGNVGAVERAVEAAKTAGAKLARLLPVGGAFHSPLMEPAAAQLAAALSRAPLQDPKIPVISNVSALPHTDAANLRQLLSAQLLSPVRWTESLQALSRMEAARWYEVGCGNVLAGLLKRTVAGASAASIGKAADLTLIRDGAAQ